MELVIASNGQIIPHKKRILMLRNLSIKITQVTQRKTKSIPSIKPLLLPPSNLPLAQTNQTPSLTSKTHSFTQIKTHQIMHRNSLLEINKPLKVQQARNIQIQTMATPRQLNQVKVFRQGNPLIMDNRWHKPLLTILHSLQTRTTRLKMHRMVNNQTHIIINNLNLSLNPLDTLNLLSTIPNLSNLGTIHNQHLSLDSLLKLPSPTHSPQNLSQRARELNTLFHLHKASINNLGMVLLLQTSHMDSSPTSSLHRILLKFHLDLTPLQTNKITGMASHLPHNLQLLLLAMHLLPHLT